MTRIELWTDGSALATGGPGGWAYVLRAIDPHGVIVREREGSGGIPDPLCTNQRAELMAVVEGLCVISRPATVTIVTDSEYVINGFVPGEGFATGWVAHWQRNGWRNRNGDPVLHRDLWEAIAGDLAHHTSVTWKHVKGHSKTYRCGRCPWTGTEPKRPERVEGRTRSRKVWCPDCENPLLAPPVPTYPLNERCDELAGAQRRALLATGAPA